MNQKMLTAALLSFPALGLAQEAYQPRLEAQIFLVSQTLDPAIGGATFFGGNPGDGDLSRLKGIGGSARLALGLTDKMALHVEAGRSNPERRYSARDLEYQVEQTQARVGLRFTAKASESPVYAAAGADFAHYQFDDKVIFGSSYTEASVGEDPALDADTQADSRAFRGKRKGRYGVAHLATGYRSSAFHGYLDVGYGLGKEDDLLEFTVGTSVSLARNVELLGEYRTTRLEDTDGDIKLNELRLGLGVMF